jgi:hypothetical protein
MSILLLRLWTAQAERGAPMPPHHLLRKWVNA